MTMGIHHEPLRLNRPAPEALLAELRLQGAAEPAIDAAFAEIRDAVLSEDRRLVILDLSQVSFLPSYGIGCIIRLCRTCNGLGRALAVTGVSEELAKVLAEMHLDRMFTIHPTVEEALAARTC